MRTDPTVLADLEELERALAGEPSPQWSELVTDVRAQRPRMDPAFAARLDARVGELRAAPPRRARWLVWSPAVAVAAAVVMAIVVVSRPSSDTSDRPASRGAPQLASGESSGGATAAAPSDATAPRPLSGRKVERTTSLTLSTAHDHVQDVADGVVHVTQRFGGIVAGSQISTSDADASAVFSLRIPTGRLDDAIAALSDLAHVAQLSQGSTDITGSFVSVQQRLSDARAERRALLVALGRATTDQQIAAIKARLRDNRSQISQDKGELNSLRRRADDARVDVTVTGDGHEGTAGGGTWTPGDAASDALRVLEVAAGVLLIGAAAVLPLALLLGAAALAARGARRRRREGALDPV